MKKYLILAVSGVLAVGTFVMAAAPSSEDGPLAKYPVLRYIAQTLVDKLDLTEDQIADAKVLAKRYQPTIKPLVDRVVAERKALNEVVNASPNNENAIRAQAARLHAAESDLVVAGAKAKAEFRALMTPEQQSKVKEMREQFAEKVDGARAAIREAILN